MKQQSGTVAAKTKGPGLYDITREIGDFVADSGIKSGLLTCFLKHTSASLVIQENADPDVLTDLHDFLLRLVSRDPRNYRHTIEGPDDMPSHIRAMLTATSLSIPVQGGKLGLGTWQAVYLFEHRDRPHIREIALHVIGE